MTSTRRLFIKNMRGRLLAHYSIIAAGVLLMLQPTQVVAQLLVGNGWPNPTNNVLRVNTTTMQVSGTFTDAVNLNPSAGAMAQDSQGRVYILESNTDKIRRYDSAGHFIDIFASTGFGTNSLQAGMAFDAAGNLYVSSSGADSFNNSDDAIVRFSSNGIPLGVFGQASFTASGFIGDGPLAFDKQGNLYTSYGGQIVRYSPTGAALGVFINHFALELAFNPQGDLFTSSSDILRYSSTGAPLGTFASGYGSGGLAIDSLGNVYATDISGNTFQKFGPSGAVLGTISSPNVSGPGSLLILVPEPGTLALLGLMLTIGTALRLVRRRCG